MITKVQIPKWLDELIFKELGAKYHCSKSNITVVNWDRNDILTYLGTYFPRSYAESYCIFREYFLRNKDVYKNSKTLSIFDFGCGTGGELIGLLVAISEFLPTIKSIDVSVLDGNIYALRLLEVILSKTSVATGINISNHFMPVIIDDFYDMNVVMDVITMKYDFIITFKAICEFVTMQQFKSKNPYEHFLNVFMPKLSPIGIVCIADISVYNNVSNDWLPNMLDKALYCSDVEIISRNRDFNDSYYVRHSKKWNDLSKIVWCIIKLKTNKV